MLIHGFNDHYRKHEKDLLMGEHTRVFANADDQNAQDSGKQQEDKDPWLEKFLIAYPEAAGSDDTDLIKEIRKMIPGKTPYSPGNISKVRATWQSLSTEYNALDTYVKHYHELINSLDTAALSPRWRNRFERLYENMKRLQELKGFDVDIDAMQKRQQEELNFEVQSIKEDIQKISTQLIKQRTRVLGLLEEQMKNDFESRVDWLIEQWDKNPPPGYEEKKVKESFIDELKGVKKSIAGMPSLRELGNEEYNKVWQDLEKYEDKYSNANTDGRFEFDIADLEKMFSDLHSKRENAIVPISAKYKEKNDKAIASLKDLITQTRLAENMEEKDRENTLDGLNKTLEKLEANQDLSQITWDILESDEQVMTTDPETGQKKPVYVFDTNVPLKKGLRHQIDLMKDPKIFTPNERTVFAKGLAESLEKCDKEMNEMIDYCNEGIDVLNENLDRQLRTGINPPGSKSMQWQITWIAPYDIMKAGEIIKNWSTRRYNRASTARVGKLGSSILSPLASQYNPISPLRTLPNEFDKEIENAEKEEVQKYKDIYSNKDMWQVEAIAHSTKNKDELKACLYLLADNGRIRWDRPELLKQFNRFQSSIQISLDMQYNLSNLGNLYDQIRRAIGYMWDFDTFNTMQSTNQSSYDSKKSSYEQNCHTWAETEGGLNKIIDKMLNNVKSAAINGTVAKEDPILYEKIIDYAIKYGKMGSEEKLYYIVQGIALGILAPDRGSVLNGLYINDYPAIDYFGASTARGSKPKLEDIQEVAVLDKKSFVEWFHVKALNLERVTQRIDKTLTQGNRLDHDDLTPYLAYMSESTTETMLKAHSDGFRLPQTGIQNASVGMLFFLDNFGENFEKLPNNEHSIQRFVGSFTRYDGILMNRMYKKEKNQYFRWDTTTYNDGPRSKQNYSGFYGRDSKSGLENDMSCKDNVEKIRSYISMLDKEFFDALYSGKVSTDDEANNLAKRIEAKTGQKVFGENTPKTVDELYQAAGAYAGWIARNQPGALNNMVTQIKSDHDKAMQLSEENVIRENRAVSESKVQQLRDLRASGQIEGPTDWYTKTL